MTLREKFEVLSLGLTPMTVMLSLSVLVIWGGRALQGLFKREKTDLDWLILGIVISFIGKLGDNMWWGFAWHFAHEGHDQLKDWWFSNGVFSNSMFRQGCGLLSAICHVQAGLTSNKLSCIVGVAVIVGLTYALILVLL